jgi:ADP-ribose pyrophosphatase YjhB (NUDIX family)
VFCSSCGAGLPGPAPITCPRCGVTHYANAKPCGGALVVDDVGRLLLVRRAHDPYLGAWDIPGGFCDLREHPADAARREVLEETGLEVAIGDLVGMWMDDYGDTGQVTLNVYFHARVVGGSERTDPEEVAELGWFEADRLPAEIAFPDHEGQVLTAWLDSRHDRSAK